MIIAKSTVLIKNMEEMQGRVEFDLLAPQLKDPLLQRYEFLSDVIAAATIVNDAATDPREFPKLPDVKDVNDAIADAKKQMAMITNMLAQIIKMQKENQKK